MTDHRSAIDRLYQRMLAVVGRGKIELVNDAGPAQVIQIVLSAREIRDNAPRLAEYGFVSYPVSGSDAVMIFAGGDRSNGVIVATGDQRYRLQLQNPGEVGIHDNQGQTVVLGKGGIVIDSGPTGNPVTINTSGSVNINASGSVDVNATGDAVITAGGSVQLGGAGGKKIVLDGDPVIGGGGGTVRASSTKVKGT